MKKIFLILIIGFCFISSYNAQTVKLQMVADSLVSPLALVDLNDGSGRMFVVEQTGLIRIMDSTGVMMEEPFLDLTDKLVELREGYDERGLLGLAFHPDFQNNGRFYVHYSAPPSDTAYDHNTVISEFTLSENDSNMADTASERILLNLDHPQFNHNGGALAFGPQDGYLYIAIGDGGGANDTGFGHVDDWYDVNPGGNGQDVEENLLGNILRIDVDGIEPYGIPLDNPFVDDTVGMEEIYAYGFRNPYSMTFDMGGNNQLFVGDAGQDLYEEVSVVESGGNYGWNIKEGTHCFNADSALMPLPACPDSDAYGNPLIDPVLEFTNSSADSVNGLGVVVIGGYVYRGTAIPELTGQYIFGAFAYNPAFPSGRIFAAMPGSTDSLWNFEPLLFEEEDSMTALQENPGQIDYYLKGFAQDSNGEIYLLTSENAGPAGNTGKVFKLVPSGFPTDVAGNNSLPVDYKVYPAYPNPFNPVTTLRYYVPQNSQVKLDVFDIMGQKISTLVNEVKNQGMHEAQFDASGLSSGVYFYKFESSSKVITGKLILMK